MRVKSFLGAKTLICKCNHLKKQKIEQKSTILRVVQAKSSDCQVLMPRTRGRHIKIRKLLVLVKRTFFVLNIL